MSIETKDVKPAQLLLLLQALRDQLNFPSYMSKEQKEQSREIERLFADRCMFNLGWHAARATKVDTLKGAASTEALLPALVSYTEAVAATVKPPERWDDPDIVLPGRPKGSYESWHYEPGYQVVLAMAETQRDGKSMRERIRWGIKKNG
jgi:hypothetical protein